jgi:hypothetical protein
LDEHLTTNTQFRDYMQDGILIEPGIRLSCAVTKLLTISWDLSWRYISGTKGYSEQRTIGSELYNPSGEAGAGLSIIATGLSLKVRL